MRAIPVIVLLLGFSLFASAQYISLNGGFAFPSSDYSNSKISRPEDGFAKTGFQYSLQAGYLFTNRVGICVNIGQVNNPFDGDKYAEGLQSQSVTSGQEISVDVRKNYKSSYAMAGAYVSLPTKHISFDIKAMMGVLSMSTPEYVTSYKYSGNTSNTLQSSRQTNGIAFGWGVTAKYELPKDFYLMLNLDNIYSPLKYTRDYTSSTDSQVADLTFMVYQLGIGVGYKIQY